MGITKAVILARGLGTRMKKAAASASGLTAEQQAAAAAGMKAMMPDASGRPFLDHCLSTLADAGVTHACLVIGPEHQHVRDYYDALPTERLTISYAIQTEPLGTADAVAAAEEFAGDDRIIVVNGDNHYPRAALEALGQTTAHASIGFEPHALATLANIPADRIAAFALLDVDADGRLTGITEKPSAAEVAARPRPLRVSMNCFAFTPAIFEACRRIEKSARGEYEITDAVRMLLTMGERFDVVDLAAGVWDLSGRDDIASIMDQFSGREVYL